MESYSSEDVKKLYLEFDKIFLDKVKPFIEENFERNKYSEPVYYILDNFILRRFRAALPILMAESLNVPIEKVMPIAATSELMFTIALVQDDFFDRCEKRGDIDSAPKKFGQYISMASSDYSYAISAKLLKLIEYQNIKKETIQKIEDAFIDMQKIAFESVLMELLNEKNFDITTEKVIELHKAKTIHGTNAIYAAALVCDDHNRTFIAEKIKDYCFNTAIAAQIKNDLYDLTRYSKTRGYSDILNGYMVYPLAKLKESLNEKDKKELKRFFVNGEAEKIVEMIKKNNIIEKCIEDNLEYIRKGVNNINHIFTGKLKEIFEIWTEGNKVNRNQVLSNS